MGNSLLCFRARVAWSSRRKYSSDVLRAFVACGWFGIQSSIGGQSICAMVNVLWPATSAMPWVLWTCFLGFWLLNMAVVWRGVESIRFLQSFSAPFLLIMSLVLLAFMTHKAGGFGPMLDAPLPSPARAFSGTSSSSRPPVHGRLLGHISLNIPDFTRYAKSQESQILGQTFGLPIAMTLYTFIGIACTSASTVVFGHPIWSPITLLGQFHQPLIAFLALISILIVTST